jgi:S1-C subfamily serine protease
MAGAGAACTLQNDTVKLGDSRIGVPVDSIVQVCAKVFVLGKELENPHARNQPLRENRGTGFAVAGLLPEDDSSAIVTAYHVVQAAHSIWAYAHSCPGVVIEASIAFVYPERDMAVLRIGRTLPALQLSKTQPSVGEAVVALGYPGELTYTAGTISRIDGKHIQTTATLNHGNSGGPLLRASDGTVLAVTLGQIEQVNSNFIAVDIAYLTIGLRRPRSGCVIDDVVLPLVYARDQSATRIASVHPTAASLLSANDIIAAIDGQPVTADGQVGVGLSRRNISEAIQLVAAPSVALDITPSGGGQNRRVVVPLLPRPDVFGLVSFVYERGPRQDNFGGIVVRPAYTDDIPWSSFLATMAAVAPYQAFLRMSHISAYKYNMRFDPTTLLRVAGRNVTTLADYAQAIESALESGTQVIVYEGPGNMLRYEFRAEQLFAREKRKL